MKKKIFSSLIALAMVVCLTPITAFAGYCDVCDDEDELDYQNEGDTHGVYCGRTGQFIRSESHSFDSYTYNNDATCVKNGTKTGRCGLCGATDTVTDSDHLATGLHVASDQWTMDETNHWKVCKNDGCNAIIAGTLGTHVDETVRDHKCDTCGKVISTCADDDNDHRCDVCGTELTDHSGGTATCNAKATCDVCHQEYGEKDLDNHANLKHFQAKAASAAEEGNKEYWYCDACKKYYSDENAQNEVKLSDILIAKLAPTIIKKDGQTVTAGEKKSLEFTSDAAFKDFVRVEIDGKTLDQSNYTVQSGSTIVTLNADYVASLSEGQHSLAIVSQSGTAIAKFTVNNKTEGTTATTTSTDKTAVTAATDKTATTVTTDKTKSPKTSDSSDISLWIALLFVSGGAVTATKLVSLKKK